METILLVEDNKLFKIMHERVLSRAGYKIVTAGDGEEGLQVARQTPPDVILLDMMLPRLSGPEVLRALKNNPETSEIPVVVVTGLSRKNASKLESEGANAFVAKEELLDGIEPLLRTLELVLKEAAGRKRSAAKAKEDLSWTPGDIDSQMGTARESFAGI